VSTRPPARRARARTVDVCGHVADLRWSTADGDDARVALAVERALPDACAAIGARGLTPSTLSSLTIHADVDTFVSATGQTTDTLRAWTTPTAVHLLVGPVARDNEPDRIGRRVTHELCHVGLWARVGPERARAARVPRALEEGVCSVVAGQHEERADRDWVVAEVAGGRTIDFVDDSSFAYAFAHHVTAMMEVCGRDLVEAYERAVAGATPREVLGASPTTLLGGACRDDEQETALPPRGE